MYSEFYDKHLKTFAIEQNGSEVNQVPFLGSIPEMFRLFERVTGANLTLVRTPRPGQETQEEHPDSFQEDSDRSLCLAVIPIPDSDGGQKTSGRVVHDLTSDSAKKTSRSNEDVSNQWVTKLLVSQPKDKTLLIPVNDICDWANALAAMLGEVFLFSRSLREREMELAAIAVQENVATNLFYSEHKSSQLADRVTMLLKKGAQVIDCQAASLYLLDNETTSLKLRAMWGLPEERLTEPARPLRGSLADLEALLGNAVILNESYLFELWRAPECFATSICIPIQSVDSILGTIWFFSDNKNDFSQKDLQILEIVSGRIALELEQAIGVCSSSH